jgi:hypothetical protein
METRLRHFLIFSNARGKEIDFFDEIVAPKDMGHGRGPAGL